MVPARQGDQGTRVSERALVRPREEFFCAGRTERIRAEEGLRSSTHKDEAQCMTAVLLRHEAGFEAVSGPQARARGFLWQAGGRDHSNLPASRERKRWLKVQVESEH